MTCNVSKIKALADAHDGWVGREEGACLCVTHSTGLEAWVAVSGEQIIVETLLFGQAQVNDVAGLNARILRTHQLFPLTAIAIKPIDGEDYYVAFGALSSRSGATAIELELEALFDNVAGFLDVYQDYLKPQ